MSTRITIPGLRPGRQVFAGIAFDDGVAVINRRVSPGAAELIAGKGGSIVVQSAEEVRDLSDMTAAELLEFAAAQNPPIEVAKSASKKSLYDAITLEQQQRFEGLQADPAESGDGEDNPDAGDGDEAAEDSEE